MRFVRAAMPALLVASFLVAGCGSSAPRLTRGEFTQRANAICSRYTTLVQGLRSGLSPTDLAAAQATVAQALPVVRAGNDELRTLRPPSELQDAYNRWLDTSDRQLDAMQQLEDALAKSDLDNAFAAFRTLGSTNAEQVRLDQAELGLTECGKTA